MGSITLEKADRLYWLGRYTERVYTTLREFFTGYDTMIDELEDSYNTYCRRLNIPNIYASKEDFLERYPFDESNPDSIISNLIRAYDNAIVMREEITSESLAYVQMAIYEMKKAQISNAPLLSLQNVLDNILAFWGCADDSIEDDEVRNIIKVGKRAERLDLYLRLYMPIDKIEREYKKLQSRIRNANIRYEAGRLEKTAKLFRQGKEYYSESVAMLEQVF